MAKTPPTTSRAQLHPEISVIPTPCMPINEEAQYVRFQEDDISRPTPTCSNTSRSRWTKHSHRAEGNFEDVLHNHRFRQAELIKRPRAHQYTDLSSISSNTPLSSGVSRTPSNESGGDKEERASVFTQLSRLDLFVDLIWVGIIANLSGTYSKQAFTDSGTDIGTAVLEFFLLFLPIWRVWDNLRDYCINFYTDDVFQRNFLVWILMLAVFYGVNAPYAFVPGEPTSLTLLIGIYLVIRASFIAAFALQCKFLPFLWKSFTFKFVCSVIAGGFWIGAIYTPWPGRTALLVVANCIEHPITIWLHFPAADRMLTPGHKRNPHVKHWVERYENFFIIILGEGVFRIIDGSPSGMGITSASGTVIAALSMYYMLHWLYFNGDRTKKFVHALRGKWWKPVLWQTFHLYLFGSLLILSTSTLFLVKANNVTLSESLSANNQSAPLAVGPGSGSGPPAKREGELYAMWSASIALGTALFAMTIITLLNHPRDKPGTLLVGSRWIRLGLRIPVITVILCLPLIKNLSGSWWCGGSVLLLYVLFLWEWVTGLEKDWKLFEARDPTE